VIEGVVDEECCHSERLLAVRNLLSFGVAIVPARRYYVYIMARGLDHPTIPAPPLRAFRRVESTLPRQGSTILR